MEFISEEHYKIIERFFNCELDDEERIAFDLLMERRAFREAVILQNTLRKALIKERKENPLMNQFGEEALKYKKNIQLSYSMKEPKSQIEVISLWLKSFFSSTHRLGYLTIVLFGAILSTVWWANMNYSNDSIVQEFHEQLLDSRQAGPLNREEILEQAEMAFFEGKFYLTENLLLRIDSQNETVFIEAQSLLAYTYFRSYQYDKSINQFNTLIENYYNFLPYEYQDLDKLRWTRLLSYLGEGREEEDFFLKELNYFVNNKSEVYREMAMKLEYKLSSSWRKLTFN